MNRFLPISSMNHCDAGFLLVVLALASLFVGCHRSEQASKSTTARTTAPLQIAFKDAEPKVKSLANDAAAAIQDQDVTKAFVQLNVLSATPNLTEQQRNATLLSLGDLNRQLSDAAANGDKAAARLLEMYKATK